MCSFLLVLLIILKNECLRQPSLSNVLMFLLFINCTNVCLLFSWKNPNNDFKKTLKLSGVPTLLRYGTVRHTSNTLPLLWTFMVLRRVLVSGPITALAAGSPRRKVKIFVTFRHGGCKEGPQGCNPLALCERGTIISPLLPLSYSLSAVNLVYGSYHASDNIRQYIHIISIHLLKYTEYCAHTSVVSQRYLGQCSDVQSFYKQHITNS